MRCRAITISAAASDSERVRPYLLIGVHAGEATRMAGLAALARDVLDLAVGAVGEVAGVLVVGHLVLIFLVLVFQGLYLI